MTGSPTVYIVDEDPAARNSLVIALSAAGVPTRAYGSAGAFLDDYRARRPGCLVVDIHLPGMGGLGLQQLLAERGSPVPIIFTTACPDTPTSVRAIKCGAVDVLEKPIALNTLLVCIDEALQEEAERAAVAGRFAQLTPRQREVMAMVAKGDSNKVIARRLRISPRTVEVHRARVMEKMKARSLSALIWMAHECGILTRFGGGRLVPAEATHRP